MFFVSTYEKAKDQPLLKWIAGNDQLIEQGAASYQGQRVTKNSNVTRYGVVCSCLIATMRTHTPFLLADSEEARAAALRSTLVTALFGWWALFGIGYTPITLIQNLRGGDKRTVEQVIYDLNHPDEAARKANQYRPVVPIIMIGMLLIGLLTFVVMIIMYGLRR
jgi:hypothetical protein